LEKADAATGGPDVLAVLKPKDLNTYTGSRSNFSFDGITPKQYARSLGPDTLPECAEVPALRTLTVKLAQANETTGREQPGLESSLPCQPADYDLPPLLPHSSSSF
jgi:hypothetical protein